MANNPKGLGKGLAALLGDDASKFGLTSSELLQALNILDEKGLHDSLRLIHFHIGSQITKIRRIQIGASPFLSSFDFFRKNNTVK